MPPTVGTVPPPVTTTVGPVIPGPEYGAPGCGFGCAPGWRGWFAGNAGDQPVTIAAHATICQVTVVYKDNAYTDPTVVCDPADLTTAESVVLRRGDVVPALLASSAIPGIFPPVRIGDRWLVDGWFLANAPLAWAAAQGFDTVYVLRCGGIEPYRRTRPRGRRCPHKRRLRRAHGTFRRKPAAATPVPR